MPWYPIISQFLIYKLTNSLFYQLPYIGCNFASVHYHLHGCHHLVCPRCNTNYCTSCLKSGDENMRERGTPSACACPSRYWSTFCNDLRTREDISDYLEIRPVPYDIRCRCIICPDCAFQKPCDSCSGYCAVCTGDLPPSIKELGAPYDVSVSTEMDLPSRYRRAMRLNNCDKLRTVLEEAKNELSEHDFMKLLHNKSKRGITALHDACRFNCYEAVKVLLGYEVFNVLTTDNKNNTALHVAFDSNDFHGSILPLIETIVAADGNILQIQNNDGDFPLHIAGCSGRLEHIQYLLSTRPELVNVVNNDGDTALHKVANFSWQWNDPDDKLKEDIVKIFLNYNCDLAIKNKKGRTPLETDYADTLPLGSGSKYGNFISTFLSKTIKHVESNNNEELKILLGECPILGLIALDSDKNTALHIASFNENLDTIQLLCTPETINLKNIRGETPLYIAALSNHMATIKFLIQNKANSFMKDIKGKTFLDLLTKEERKEINEYMKETKCKN